MADDAVANGLRRQGRLRRRDRRMDPKPARQGASDNRLHDEAKFNLATDGAAHARSSFKVTTLGTVLQNGYSRHDQVDGASPCTVPGFGREGTRNAEGDGGLMTIDAAATGSVNCALVRMSTSVGMEKVIDMAQKMGMRPNVAGRQPVNEEVLTSRWASSRSRRSRWRTSARRSPAAGSTTT